MLRNDFVMGAKLKNWKQSDDEDEDEEEEKKEPANGRKPAAKKLKK